MIRRKERPVPLDPSREFFSLLSLPPVIEAIEEDHADLRKYIEVLKGERAPIAQRRQAYRLFSQLLRSHTIAEEKTVYAFCEKNPSLRHLIHLSVVEHDMAAELMRQADRTKNSGRWQACVQVLAETVERHLLEEEEQVLPALKRLLHGDRSGELSQRFFEIRKQTQRPISSENAGVLA